MSFPLPWLVPAALPGHVSWLLWLGNVLHAADLDRRFIKTVAYLINCLIFFGSTAAAWWAVSNLVEGARSATLPSWLTWYFTACAVNTVVGTLPWLVRAALRRDAAVLLSTSERLVDLRPALGRPLDANGYGRLLLSIPRNESLQIVVNEKRVRMPRLPASLEGLRIVHAADFHICGRIGKPFYERIVDLVNEAEADLVLLTGDLIEKETLWDWIPDVFGQMRSQHGAYFVFGNHDVRIDERETRRRLTAAGLTDVGGQVRRVAIEGIDVMLAGNERPWIAKAADVPKCPPRESDGQLKILLSHSPDQYRWARDRDFDLMLAGHVHGGQIQIPPLGPILAPSYHGVKYACGTFYEPPTVLHVTRGLSSKLPLRFFCKPELTTLVLTGEA